MTLTNCLKNMLHDDFMKLQLYIEKTETTKGLKVAVRIIDKVFKTGRKYAADFKKNMAIQFDKFLPKWNYVAIPCTN